MDIDACLSDIRHLVALVLESDCDSDEAIELAELVSGLDDWMSRGGCMPKEWERLR